VGWACGPVEGRPVIYYYQQLALQGQPVNPYPDETKLDELAKQCVTRFSQL
jgi:hypothetical protein